MTDEPPNGQGAGGIRFLFRALRHRNYRLFFFGQGVSVIGTWMQGAALGWLIKVMTGSDAAFWLGFIPAMGQLPTFILPPLTGVLADRHDRRRIMMITQSLAMTQAMALALCAAMGLLNVGWLIGFSVAIGLINSFDIPARQSFTVDMLDDRNDLSNAIALNSSLVNGARVVGPALGGILIAALTELAYDVLKSDPTDPASRLPAVSLAVAACFFLNALSYIAVLSALARMKVQPRPAAKEHPPILRNLREGWRYVTGSPPIRTVLMLIALTSFMGVSYGALMPEVAQEVLHVGPLKYGTLLSAVGIGALGGAGFLASRKSVRGLKTIIAIACAIFGTGLIAFSLVDKYPVSVHDKYWLALPLLVVTGFGFMVTMSSSNTFIQAIVDDDKRGRVMSFWTMSFMGMVPLGSFFTGFVAHSRVGPMWTIFIGGCACVLGAAAFATRLPMLRRLTHPIYLRKGVITQTALGGAEMLPQTAEEMDVPPPPVNGDRKNDEAKQ